MRRRLLLAALTVPAALVPSGVAAAANVDVHSVDGTPANNFVNSWSPPSVSIQAGDSVTWRFDGDQGAHNVASDSPNWSLDSPVVVAGPAVTYQFNTPGTYRFVCDIHPDTMTGSVAVGAAGEPPPPPPPVDSGPQPFPNPTDAPEQFERADDERPRVTRLHARSVRRGARVRFRLSEDARVTIRFERSGRTIRRTRLRLDDGTHRMTVRSRRLRRGSYRVQVRARDYAGNKSRRTHDRVRIR